jgi:hypothetical protein
MRINGLSGLGFLVMIPCMKKIAPMVRASCVIASLSAITPRVAHPQDAVCRAPARINAGAAGAEPAPLSRVRNYRPIFQQCHNALNQTRLAIRRMSVGAENPQYFQRATSSYLGKNAPSLQGIGHADMA